MKPLYSRITGWLLIALGLMMTAPLAVAVYYSDYKVPATKHEITAFAISIALTCGTGVVSLLFSGTRSAKNITVRDGFQMAATGWIVCGCFSALPYLLTGVAPNFIDAFFESMSGISTTGASVFTDLDLLPRGIMFWRCMTQWIGGMGIIGLFVAILPMVGEGSANLFRAEIPGGANFEKVTPRIGATARALWSMYAGLTVLEISLLFMAGMPLYESFCHTFATLSTGGFSTYSGGFGDVDSVVIKWIVIVFMTISGASFTLHYRFLRGEGFVHKSNEEFRLFIAIILTAFILITANLFLAASSGSGAVNTITDAMFQVVSIITTTGYSSADFAGWSAFAQSILLCLMFVGGSSGSTSGSVKVIRHLLAGKGIATELRVMANPREVVVAKLNGKPLTDDTLRNTLVFMALFLALFIFGGLVVTMTGEDMTTAFTASIACLGNVGPGLGDVGPALNYGGLHPVSKLVLIIEMLMGRLELFGFLIFFMALVARKGK